MLYDIIIYVLYIRRSFRCDFEVDMNLSCFAFIEHVKEMASFGQLDVESTSLDIYLGILLIKTFL